MSGNTSPGTSHLPTYYYFNTTMAPSETKMNSLQRGPQSILTNAADNDQRSPAPRQKFVHFAPRAIDNENNEFKTKTNDEKQKRDAIAFSISNDSKRNRISSSSELNKVGSSRSDLSSTQIQSSHHRTIREKPIERRSGMKFATQNSTSSQGRQFKLVAPNTTTQYLPRVPSPPMNRGPPPTPRPARLPTPDLENPCDCPLNFCDCLRCYEAEMLRRGVESRREVSAYSKMENQCEIIPRTRPFRTDSGRSSSNCLHKRWETSSKRARARPCCRAQRGFSHMQLNRHGIPTKRCHQCLRSV
ncbi:hypothetical protein OCU04_005330 [Sclerotinia nivalis]|uniref:Uncharacterized protein n=1 Tax=Sclerotinia nivalis TaxID=352851 RepID=A0A9X0APT7_9HELO|nr:hypothetical protein OCU04_005330 [Sclerotinia nivalis]